MTLNLISHKVIAIDFKQEKKESISKTTLNYEIVYSEKNKNQFHILFHLKIIKQNLYNVNIDYLSTFQSSDIIDENYLNGNFAKINAPAIAFPFLRSFVSFLILTAGFQPLILKSVNFTKFEKEKIPIKITE